MSFDFSTFNTLSKSNAITMLKDYLDPSIKPSNAISGRVKEGLPEELLLIFDYFHQRLYHSIIEMEFLYNFDMIGGQIITTLLSNFSNSDTQASISQQDGYKFPANGEVVVNEGLVNEEVLRYSLREDNILKRLFRPVPNTHLTGSSVKLLNRDMLVLKAKSLGMVVPSFSSNEDIRELLRNASLINRFRNTEQGVEAYFQAVMPNIISIDVDQSIISRFAQAGQGAGFPSNEQMLSMIATVIGTVSGATFDVSIASGNNQLALKIDNSSTITVNFTNSNSLPIATVVSEINTAIDLILSGTNNLCSATVDNKIKITSKIFGGLSEVNIVVGNDGLGFEVGEFQYSADTNFLFSNDALVKQIVVTTTGSVTQQQKDFIEYMFLNKFLPMVQIGQVNVSFTYI